MRRFSLAIASLFLLVGCGEDVEPETFEEGEVEEVVYLYPETVTLNDGQIVECVMTTYVNALWCTPSEGNYE